MATKKLEVAIGKKPEQQRSADEIGKPKEEVGGRDTTTEGGQFLPCPSCGAVNYEINLFTTWYWECWNCHAINTKR
jgi:hypothetical protein